MDQTIQGTTPPAHRSLLLWLMFPLLLAGGLYLQQWSLATVRNIHKLERLPMSPINAAIPGVIKTTGKAAPAEGKALLSSKWTETPCLWYRALKERRKTDSEGRTYWDTELDEQRGTSYLLEDDAARIMIHPDLDRVDVSLERKWTRTDGDLRYREWRIDPGDRLIVVGKVELDAGTPEIHLAGGGEYLPIITDRPIENLRGTMALHAVLMIVGSVFCVATTCVCLVLGLRIHNTLAFITISGLLQACLLLVGGTLMIASDLRGANQALDYSTEAARRMVESRLSAEGISWNGDWSDEAVFDRDAGSDATRDSIAAIRSALAARTNRTIELQQRLPQRLVAWAIDVSPPVPIPDDGSLATVAAGRIETARIGWAWPTIGVIGSLLIGVIGAWAGLRRVRVKRLIENIPTTPCSEVEIGVTEIVGRLKAGSDEEEPLLGPLTEEPCLWYRYLVQEWRGSGKERRLVTIEDTTRTRPIACEDESGLIPVLPADAEIITGRAPKQTRGNHVYTEYSLREDDPLYVLGSGEIDPETGDSLRVEQDLQQLPFIISNLPERRLKTMKISAAFWLLAFAVAGVASLILFGTLFSGGVSALDELLAALGAITMMGFCMVIILYNDLVFLRQRTHWARSNIEVALKKRHDLLPNLDRVCTAYLEHERGLQESIAGLRAAYARDASAPTGPAGDRSDPARGLERLLAIRESNPQLKADTVVDRLFAGIVELENEIAAKRSGYNASVERYRSRLMAFPELLIARIGGFRNEPLLETRSEMTDLHELDFTRTDEEAP